MYRGMRRTSTIASHAAKNRIKLVIVVPPKACHRVRQGTSHSRGPPDRRLPMMRPGGGSEGFGRSARLMGPPASLHDCGGSAGAHAFQTAWADASFRRGPALFKKSQFGRKKR